MGITAKGVDYDGFPIDAGTIVACAILDPGKRYRPVIAANNLYHDYETTRRLGAMAVREAARMGRRVAVVRLGGLSGSTFTREIDIADDHIASPADDKWSRRVLELMTAGDGQAIREPADYSAGGARVDMGFKHFAWLAGAIRSPSRHACVTAEPKSHQLHREIFPLGSATNPATITPIFPKHADWPVFHLFFSHGLARLCMWKIPAPSAFSLSSSS